MVVEDAFLVVPRPSLVKSRSDWPDQAISRREYAHFEEPSNRRGNPAKSFEEAGSTVVFTGDKLEISIDLTGYGR